MRALIRDKIMHSSFQYVRVKSDIYDLMKSVQFELYPTNISEQFKEKIPRTNPRPQNANARTALNPEPMPTETHKSSQDKKHTPITITLPSDPQVENIIKKAADTLFENNTVEKTVHVLENDDENSGDSDIGSIFANIPCGSFVKGKPRRGNFDQLDAAVIDAANPKLGGKKQRGRGGTLMSRAQYVAMLRNYLKGATDDMFASYVQNTTREIMDKYNGTSTLDQKEKQGEFEYLYELYLLTGSPPSIAVFDEIERASNPAQTPLSIAAMKRQTTISSSDPRLVPRLPFRPPATPTAAARGGTTIASTPNKIHILGRDRKIFKIGRTLYIIYQKQQIKLVDARKLDKKQNRTGKNKPLLK